MRYQNLAEVLIDRMDEEGRDNGLTFIEGSDRRSRLSYRDLGRRALALTARLQAEGFSPGEEVILQLEDNRQFVLGFWACLLGGMIPVPVSVGKNDEHRMKVFRIWSILERPRLLSTADCLAKMLVFAEENGLPQANALRERSFPLDENESETAPGEVHQARPDDLAFIQFSSGSTGDPKGVMVTHRNVLVNLDAIIRRISIGAADASLNWMPLTHDMGLIGVHIKDVLAGIDQYQMPTSLFVRHPSIWLEEASANRASLLYSPNFGYKHFLSLFREDQEKEWDLRAVRLIFNGAEPISLELCREFMAKMERFGLRHRAMYPVYGLAEGTIGVAFPDPGQEIGVVALHRGHLGPGARIREIPADDPRALLYVEEGDPIEGCALRIGDGAGRDLGEDRVGRIEIRGDSVTAGYYRNAAATAAVIDRDGWLDTGDLGFVRHGSLVVTGRAKDIVFAAGQNYFSHDIERAAEGAAGIELGKIAAVGVFDPAARQDRLIVFVLHKGKAGTFLPILDEVRRIIAQRLGIEAAEVIPIRSLPKTTSGKVQRFKLRQLYASGEFDAIRAAIAAARNERKERAPLAAPAGDQRIREELTRIWIEILGGTAADVRADFFTLGGDSIKAMQVIARIRERLRVELDPAALFAHPGLEELAKAVSVAEQADEEREIAAGTEREEPSPLSFAQQRLWFLDKLHGHSPQYNLSGAFRLRGDLDLGLLEQSLQTVVDRHQILRLTIEESEGRPWQKIQSGVAATVTRIDLSGQTDVDESERQALGLARLEAARPFDPRQSLLPRVLVIRLAERDYLLVFVVHHLVFDGWSLGIFLRELAACYDRPGSPEARGGSLPALPLQYQDYARWQVERWERGELAGDLAYWREKLSGELPVLSLPLEGPRPAIQTFQGERIRFAWDPSLWQSLVAMARREKVTPFMFLLAAFKVLLYRYTGQADLIVGSPIANRGRSELEGLIGFFANNLVLRTFLSGDLTFRQVLARVKTTCREAFSHQEVPFEKLVEELHLARDMSRNPLFQVFFNLQSMPGSGFTLAGLELQSVPIEEESARFDLSLELMEADSRLSGAIEYNTDLFRPEVIAGMLGHYEYLLRGILADPETEVAALEILPESEKQRLLVDLNQTAVRDEPDDCWVRLFETEARKNPDAVAVADGEGSLTYGRLHLLSSRLAAELQRRGVRPGEIIGLHVERSAGMLIAMMAIHKAGGAYLPLDPSFPGDRLAFMIEDAGLRSLLSSRRLAGGLPAHQATVHDLDELVAAASDENSGADPEAGRSMTLPAPGDLAYLIYTSGSTGRPKGVEIEQRSLTNLLLAMKRAFDFAADDAMLAVTTLSFDIAALELLLPLVSGGRVAIAAKEDTVDGIRLGRMIADHRATFMQATPATWRLLLGAGWRGDRHLTALCGGETLPRELAQELLSKVAALHNLYGPTETTIWSTMKRIETRDRMISIGRPIANTRIYLLDQRGRLVPEGVAGEIHIGGTGVGRGYRNLPELTAERFLADPFGAEGSRMYRTGDLARYLPGGDLEYLGRTDAQVKLRGYRIEPGEIETVLRGHPAVKDCVVAVRERIPGEAGLVAYVIAPGVPEFDSLAEDLRRLLQAKLPSYMIPGAFMALDGLPLTPNGKIDRRALPAPAGRRNVQAEAPGAGIGLEREIVSIWREVLGVDEIRRQDNFFDLGGSSLLLGRVQALIEKRLKRAVAVVDLFRHPNIQSLAGFLGGSETAEPRQGRAALLPAGSRTGRSRDGSIAIIGMSGRFPGARDLNAFWRNLRAGVESIRRFTREEAAAAGAPPDWLRDERYVGAWGVLEDADRFDAGFFGYNPREAELLDPQQRVFLELAWAAFEHAGYDPARLGGPAGVFAGAGPNTYLSGLPAGLGNDPAEAYQLMIGNDKDFLATRVAYKLGLEGPGLTVQTACSTSLVAVHLACRSLLDGECDLALAGGVSIRFPQERGYLAQEGMILSPDGHCRAFDAAARGTVGGNGAGVVVLKRLEEAVADCDTIHAVIRGSAVNNDGALKAGYTAPRADSQAEVIAAAQKRAGVDPASITYLETHGTGTRLGDPIEFQALTQAFRRGTNRNGFCAIGSIKPNVGHLDAAAGIAGLIKTVLAIEDGHLPPSINYEHPNPEIDLDHSPFFVNTELRPWETGGGPRRAGVSSFGIGGTNAHLILEEAPSMEVATEQARQLLVFSTKTARARERLMADFAEHLRDNPGISLSDAAYTLQVGRQEFGHRAAVVCASTAEAIAALSAPDGKRVLMAQGEQTDREVVFLFPGQGSQHVWMAGDLYLEEPVFRDELDRCAGLLLPELGIDLREILFPAGDPAAAAERLQMTAVTQPALFAVEYALARLWSAWGVKPQAMIGHSVGEYVAACLAGVFSLEDGLRLIAGRGRLMQQLPAGSMLAVSLSESALALRLNEELSIAAVNSPSLCVVAGPSASVNQLAGELANEKIACRLLHTSHAFHSRMMDPVLEPFADLVRSVVLHPPQGRYFSNLSGRWIEPAEAADPEYYLRHLRQTVRFADSAGHLLRELPEAIFLEVGPGNALSALIHQQSQGKAGGRLLSSLPHPQAEDSDHACFLAALGRLWLAGAKVGWADYYTNSDWRRRRIPLPAYPFEHKRYWAGSLTSEVGKNAVAVARNAEIHRQTPIWKQSLRPAPPSHPRRGNWLILAAGASLALAGQLAGRLRQDGMKVAVAMAGGESGLVPEGVIAINPEDPEEYRRLLRGLADAPDRILNLMGAGCPALGSDPGLLAERLFLSSLYLIQAWGTQDTGGLRHYFAVTTGAQSVFGGEDLEPEKAVLSGLNRIIPQEYPSLRCRLLDWPLSEPGPPWEEDLIAGLLAELALDDGEPLIALRGPTRWVPEYAEVPLAEETEPAIPLRIGGTYLITGGTGGIGRRIARHLARKLRAKLILICRSAFPAVEGWENWLAEHEADNEISAAIKELQPCLEAGAEIFIGRADVADPAELAAVLGQAEARLGPIRGVLHAAGLPGGGLIRNKGREETLRVLRPKVRGSLALLQALEGRRPDFLILFSSVTALAGGAGQADYAAANAFLDALAQARRGQGGPPAYPVISVNWDRWPGIGMAAASHPLIPTGAQAHPLLGRRIPFAGSAVFRRDYNPQEDWVFTEHLVAGRPTIPGTAFLEMARAAGAMVMGEEPELREVLFLTPLGAGSAERPTVFTLLEPTGRAYGFRILSRIVPPEGGDAEWREHARGRLEPPSPHGISRANLAELLGEAAGWIDLGIEEQMAPSREFISFGTRWRSLRRLAHRPGEALATLELAAEFAGDLERLRVHPALLDVATGVARIIFRGDYLPLAYGTVRIHGALPSRFQAHLRLKESPGAEGVSAAGGSRSSPEIIASDLSLYDDKGECLLEVEDFAMKRAAGWSTGVAAEPRINDSAGLEEIFRWSSGAAGAFLQDGLTEEEGLRALDEIFQSCPVPQIIVGKREVREAMGGAVDLGLITGLLAEAAATGPAHERPELKNEYVAPRNELESKLAVIWQTCLGLERVGIHDDFFELGGHSLLLAQLHTRLKESFPEGIQITDLYQHTTIATLADHLTDRGSGRETTDFGGVNERAGRRLAALRQQRPRGGGGARTK